MANNYEFSETIDDLTPIEYAWWITESERIADAHEEAHRDNDKTYRIEDCSFLLREEQTKSVCFCCEDDEGDGDMDRVVHIVQRFFKKFRPNSCFCLMWTERYSKPCNGVSVFINVGAVFVTADNQKWISAEQWVGEQQKLRKENC